MTHQMFNIIKAGKEELSEDFEDEADDEADDFDDTSGDEDEW